MGVIYKEGVLYGGSGSSLPDGGTTGQALVKKSNIDQDVEWSDVDGLPSGGTQGQVLTKQSSTDGDADWEDIDALPSGGTTGQVLAKKSNTDGDVEWIDEVSYSAGDGININNNEISTDNMPASDMSEIITPLPGSEVKRMKYSTEEQVIGEWIDGKPLYQKTIDCGALPNSTVKRINHNIKNIAFVTNFWGVASVADKTRSVFIPADIVVGSNYCITMEYRGANIIITTNYDASGFVLTYVTLQYTKTTD